MRKAQGGSLRSCLKTAALAHDCVEKALKILMYSMYTPVFRAFSPCPERARDVFKQLLSLTVEAHHLPAPCVAAGFPRYELFMNMTDPMMIADALRMRGVSGSCANQLPKNTATSGLT